MSPIATFLTGIISIGIVCLAVIAYMRTPLNQILIDLCGTEPRANFWLAFSNVTLALVPVVFAMHARPDLDSSAPAVFQFIDQLKSALIGLVTVVLMLGLVLSAFIRKQLSALDAARSSD